MSGHVDFGRFAASAGGERRSMVEHLRSCATCRAAVAAEDPAALFSLLAAAPIPARVLDDVSDDVARRAGHDRGSLGAVFASVPAMRLRLAAAAAVVGIALAGAYTARLGHPVATGRAVLSPDAYASFAQRADVDVLPAHAVSQVVDFTVGETQVVMVYNGDLDL